MSDVIFKSLGTEGDVSKFIEEREDDAYASVEEFIERLQIPVEEEGLSTDTKYFRAHGQVLQGEQVFNLTTLLYRDEKGNTIVLNRTLGQI